MRLQIIGGGKMGEALLGGLLQKNWAAATELAVIEAVPARRAELAVAFPGVGLPEAILPGIDAIVAVKPDAVVGVCQALGAAGVRRVLSIAAATSWAQTTWNPRVFTSQTTSTRSAPVRTIKIATA